MPIEVGAGVDVIARRRSGRITILLLRCMRALNGHADGADECPLMREKRTDADVT
jgi:hypothetical protein